MGPSSEPASDVIHRYVCPLMLFLYSHLFCVRVCRPIVSDGAVDHEDGIDSVQIEKQTILRPRNQYLGGVPAVAWAQVQKDKTQFSFQGVVERWWWWEACNRAAAIVSANKTACQAACTAVSSRHPKCPGTQF